MMSPNGIKSKGIVLLAVGAVAMGAGFFWARNAEKLANRLARASSSDGKVDRAIADNPPWVRGLEGVPLDQWTSALQTHAAAGDAYPDEASIAGQIGGLLQSATGLVPLFTAIGETGLAQHCSDAADYVKLAGGLLQARAALQVPPVTAGPEAFQPVSAKIILLETLAEEALYAASLIHPESFTGAGRFFVRSFPAAATSCPSRSTQLNGLPLCEGDVVTSKGDAGSSSLLARMSDRPGNFSHSTIAYAVPGSGDLRFVEAFIEDGVKLRRPDQDYFQNPSAPTTQPSGKRKMYIYRYQGPNRDGAIVAAAKSLDALVAQMQQITGNRAEQISSFDYDFQMDATTDKQLFCSEIPYWVYKHAGAPDQANPYNPAVWSSLSGAMQAFFTGFMGIRPQRYPAPSDVNFNTYFAISAMAYDVTRLEVDRIDVAMIDALIQAANTPEGSQKLQAFLQATASVGNQPPTPADKARIVAAFAASNPALAQEIGTALASAPSNITLKQLVFYAALDRVITPGLRARVMSGFTAGAPVSRLIGPLKLRQIVLAQAGPMLDELINRQAAALGVTAGAGGAAPSGMSASVRKP